MQHKIIIVIVCKHCILLWLHCSIDTVRSATNLTEALYTNCSFTILNCALSGSKNDGTPSSVSNSNKFSIAWFHCKMFVRVTGFPVCPHRLMMGSFIHMSAEFLHFWNTWDLRFKSLSFTFVLQIYNIYLRFSLIPIFQKTIKKKF